MITLLALSFGFAICFLCALLWPAWRGFGHAGLWVFGVFLGMYVVASITDSSSPDPALSTAVELLFLGCGAVAGAIVAAGAAALTRAIDAI